MSNQSVSAHVVLDALGDGTRRDIVERLSRGPLPVGELAAGLTVGRPAVSKHLSRYATASWWSVPQTVGRLSGAPLWTGIHHTACG